MANRLKEKYTNEVIPALTVKNSIILQLWLCQKLIKSLSTWVLVKL